MKSEKATLDATPSKRIYLSIIADYDLNTAISELIDNAIDVWRSNSDKASLSIQIELETDQQRITIMDNAGGVQEGRLKSLISPGESSSNGVEDSIGIFGVGSKRAVVALSQHIQLSTRYKNEDSFRLEYDDEWLTSDDWTVPYYQINEISENSTIIELLKLRFKIDDSDVSNLEKHIGRTYANFLTNEKVEIRLNDKKVESIFFNNWAYPPQYRPTRFTKTIEEPKSRDLIDLAIESGLTHEGGSIGGDYGVYFYCNNRLILRAYRGAEVGFISRVAGIPHPRMSLARIIVYLNGKPDYMPWNSSKSGINFNSPIFQLINQDIIEAVKTYTALSKRLQENFETEIKPFIKGEVELISLNKTEHIKPSKLPPIPRTRRDYKYEIINLNKSLSNRKPWVRGLYEGIIADELISRQKILDHKNRISLILLDSLLEIAFKDFLVNEITPPIGEKRIRNIFSNRSEVHKEVKLHLPMDEDFWKRIEWYYKIRCELIHKRVSISIGNEDLARFRVDVKKILSQMFDIVFPE